MVTPVVAFSSHTMTYELPVVASAPGRTMVQHLRCSTECRATMLSHPGTFWKPTHLSIHITDDECWKGWETTLNFTELERLCHTHGLCNRAPEFVTDFVVGLHVCIDEANRVTCLSIFQLYTEPALCDQRIKANGGQIRIEPGILLFKPVGAPGNDEAGTEETGNMVFAGRAQHLPSVCCKGRGQQGMSTPDLLECNEVSMLCEPFNNRLKWW